ncbi:hypothetical protein TNCV_93751 [Trichonephila clavipes]|nr:hypothetical protein TNCV_93751 [Trichonephila clavipes]
MTDLVILNHGQVTKTTSELASSHKTSHHANGRTFELSTDLICFVTLHGSWPPWPGRSSDLFPIENIGRRMLKDRSIIALQPLISLKCNSNKETGNGLPHLSSKPRLTGLQPFRLLQVSASAGWHGWFVAGFQHPRLRVRTRLKSVDFHDAKNRQRPCRRIIRHVKDP